MSRDNYERYIARDRPGLYESQYLKANSPDNQEAFWIKHNLLVPPSGGGFAELWLIWFRRGEPPKVWKREVPVGKLTLDAGVVGLHGEGFDLTARSCEGRIGNARWRFAMSGGLPPMFHFASPRMYGGAFPKKKLLTPAPNLQFDGEITIGNRTIAVSKWTGLRGHNWGSEHAHSYAYGSCNRWDDGAVDRAIDGFTARVKIAGRLTPWLSALVYWDGSQKLEHNRIRDLFNRRAEVEPTLWRVPYRDLTLQMVGDSTYYAGLRYRHPGGRESYCYNTKFASVTVTANGRDVTSKAGEHEVLYPEPLPAIPLHPTPEWKQTDGDYQSA